MQLTHLKIRDFRNLVDVELEPGAGVNLISGKNASGKTSLLEAIYYLSHLRSFRTPYLSDLINHDATELQLLAKAKDQLGNLIPIGVERSKTSLQVRANQKAIKRVADITAAFPVLAIHPDSYRLITGSPTERRAYIDWGVFHVEHGFFEAWQRYKKAIAQRNAALKTRQRRDYCQLWDRELDNAALHIHSRRQHYMDQMQPFMARLVDQFFPGQQVRLEYKRGWNEDLSLLSVLEQTLDRDLKRGLTQAGPHRADLQIQVDGKSAQTGISRGQQKLLVALLKLAQVQQFTEVAARHCILLYDDLAAELDQHNRTQVLSVLQAMPIQLFLTAIEPGQIDLQSWSDVCMFHVEQGRLS
ncbi:MAG: DNA replication/repair protein RecF [Thiotrichales bacterium]|nr:MAG: DNA replication/repair protein RecF [Thiotrichales bacterium]